MSTSIDLADRTASGGSTAAGRRRARGAATLTVSSILLLVAVIGSFGIGALDVPPLDVVRSIGGKLGLVDYSSVSPRDVSVVWDLRLPRVLLACLVGASLAVAGAALQGLFGNPLADPGVIGVSNGAAVGAVGAIVTGTTVLGTWTIPVAAFLGGLIATSIIYLLARKDPGGTTVTMLLVGIAIGAGCSAITGFFTYIADTDELQQLTFWQLGSLGSAKWEQVAIVVVPVLAGIAGVLALARPLDLLALGERQANHLGVDVVATRRLLIVLAALLIGCAVAFAGTIGFVGLVIPHIVRLLIGPGHAWLLPVSAVLGALLIVVADTLSRSIDPPLEVPLGLFTAAIGAPFFLWLIQRQRPKGMAL
ncbi:FecCD family ABC transporter permease [Millisia brevis]|uniref:FecCD family ABC transporter permease n=1 Tax=Millisia brevis TaxID=264148 RepID=UPI000AE33B1F|nr:iron ABC transporter permease [Millisia brevis]